MSKNSFVNFKSNLTYKFSLFHILPTGLKILTNPPELTVCIELL